MSQITYNSDEAIAFIEAIKTSAESVTIESIPQANSDNKLATAELALQILEEMEQLNKEFAALVAKQVDDTVANVESMIATDRALGQSIRGGN
ncbi:DUF5344 family protein [Shouchella hunanensis]|uniref:DUF5344 family protein n=1 Tax=Shouchella hunanensis TaxID=766894 RepID=A0ABY7WBL8_9BACI|nr:DUF5344 family protein [Shouchella hunanensis]WDF05202.1 DUF5344 family protein [Shouchella hunanensis]